MHQHYPDASTGFPRTRGDGPLEKGAPQATKLFPPHARGWTREQPEHRDRGQVSPARAGMDPLA